MFSFRLRFTLPDTERINLDEAQWEFPFNDPNLGAVVLKPTQKGSIKEDCHLVVRGDGYPDSESAREVGEKVRDTLTVAFARARVAADFGDRAPKSMFFDYGLKMLEQEQGGRVLNDVHGLQVFESEPPPRFARPSFGHEIGRSAESVIDGIEHLVEAMPRLDLRVRTAFDLYAASFRVQQLEARFMLLMIAVETFIQQKQREDAARELVAQFISQVQLSELSETERKSLVGSLRRLMTESIGQAGRRLAASLDGHEYDGMAPDRFFTRCYEARGKLVHGEMLHEERESINKLVGSLETFVGDLISVPFLGPRTE